MTDRITPNHREVLYTVSSITGDAEYITSTNHVLDTTSGGGGGGLSVTDGSSWTAGVSQFTPAGGEFNDSGTVLSSGQQGTLRMTAQRGQHVNLRTNTGTEIGVSASPLRIDPTGTTRQPVNLNQVGGTTYSLGQTTMSASAPVTIASDQTAVPISGTVTANLGTVGGLALDATLTGGTQQTKITDGTSIAGVVLPAALATAQTNQNGIITASTGISTGTLTLNLAGAATAWYDLLNYPSISVEVLTNSSGATLTWQTSGDTSQTNIRSMPLMDSASITSSGSLTTTSAVATLYGNRTGRYFRVSSNVSGANTVTLVLTFYTTSLALNTLGVAAALNTGTNSIGNVGAKDATGAAVPANAFYIAGNGSTGNLTGINADSTAGAPSATGTGLRVAAMGMAFNGGSSWNRVAEAQTSNGTTGSGIVGTASMSLGSTTNPTAVTSGRYVQALADVLGKQVVVGSIRELKGDQFTTITSSTSETTIVTAVASTFLDLYGLIIENTSATATEISFRDVTAGSVRFAIYVPAGDTKGFMLNESAAYKQATVNTAWTAQCGTSVASIKISALYVKNI